MGWCIVTWSRLLFKVAVLRHFCAFHGTLTFFTIGLGQEDEIEEITLQPEMWRHDTVCHEADQCIMMTSSNGNIFRVTVPLCGEFTGPGDFPTQRPVTRSFDVFFDLRMNTRLSKQRWGLWFETPSWSLWRQYNVKWPHSTNVRILWSWLAEGAVVLWTSC